MRAIPFIIFVGVYYGHNYDVIFVPKEEIAKNFLAKANLPLSSLNLRSRLFQFVQFVLSE